MATNVNNDGSGNSFLGFIVGGLLVVVVLGFLFYNGTLTGNAPTTNIKVETPAAPTAPATTPAK